MDDKLTGRNKFDIGLEALLNVIPYVGGSLATVIFGPRNEKRMKRLESFFLELSEEIRSKGIMFPEILEQNKDALAAIIEELAEKIQREHSEEKRGYYKKFFINALSSSEVNYDRSMNFMRILSDITFIEVQLLKNLYSRKGQVTHLRDIRVLPESDFEQLSALYHLQQLGFIQSGFGTQGFNMMSDRPPIASNEIILSDYGNSFVDYVLK